MIRLLFSVLAVLLLLSCSNMHSKMEDLDANNVVNYIDDDYKDELAYSADINVLFNMYNGMHYLIRIDIENKNMITYVGEWAIIGSFPKVGRITERERIDLSIADLDKMEELLLLVETFEPSDLVINGMQDITIGTKERKITYVYGNALKSELDELVGWLIEISPITILDSYGYELVPLNVAPIIEDLGLGREKREKDTES